MTGHAANPWYQPVISANPVQAFLCAVGLGVVQGLPFLRVAPNRLVSGEPVFMSALLAGSGWFFVAVAALLFFTAFFKPSRAMLWLAVALSLLLMPGLLWLAGAHAAVVASTASPLARTSLASAFWLVMLLSGLLAADALRRLGARPLARTALATAVVLTVCLLLLGGGCDELSLVKEYANRSDVFAATIGRHLQIVLLALAFTLLAGLPLGWAACKSAALERLLFPVLNIVQTIPSIALFGLLMAPLAFAASAWPLLAQAGISGVGLAPAVIALTLYSLLPVVRSTAAGLQSVPSAVVDAACGLGLPNRQIFWQVQMPLALPVVLAGVRTATIQAIGLAAVTALIGAGGLGRIMFEGLFSAAQDLVLLGVIPIVVLGLLADLGFKTLISLTRPAGLTGSTQDSGGAVP